MPTIPRDIYERTFSGSGSLPQRAVTSLSRATIMPPLDHVEHPQPNHVFPDWLTPADQTRLMDEMALAWRRGIRRWQGQNRVLLLEETSRVLTDAVLTWAGIPLKQARVASRALDLVCMLGGLGGVAGAAATHPLKARLARARFELWLTHVLRAVRRRKLQVHRHSALYVLANHRDAAGRRLDLSDVAGQLIDFFKPIVAAARSISFAALAMKEHPDQRAQLAVEPIGEGAGPYAEAFMREVQRCYLAPRDSSLGDGRETDRDSDEWIAPEHFRPERFLSWGDEDRFFLEQGDRATFSWLTTHSVTLAVHFLARCATYDVVPDPESSFVATRTPSRPASGLVIQNVRATEALDGSAPRPRSYNTTRDLRFDSPEFARASTVRH